MELLIVSFVAGILTVAAPCILPLLPVIVGGSIALDDQHQPEKNWYRPLVIAGSLAVSVVLFGLLLKATTSLLGVPVMFWQLVSGLIVTLLGVSFLFPSIWDSAVLKAGLHGSFNQFMNFSYKERGVGGEVLLGFSLGPVFNSCSPTYALIVATILPASFLQGFSYLTAYAVGLAGALLMIAVGGQSVVRRLGWLSNPGGWFRRGVGVVFILVGLSVAFGIDKKIQTYVLDRGWYAPISNLEESLR